MHSLKHTVIAVMLLGLSFGLYQVSLTPSNPAQSQATKDATTAPVNGQASLLDLGSTNSNGAIPQPKTTANDSWNIPAVAPVGKIDVPNIPTPNAAKSNLSIPKLPTLPVSPPATSLGGSAGFDPKPNGSQIADPSSTSTATDRKPLDSTIANGVQSINYPANNPASMSQPKTESQIVQREPEKASVEQGLINALKTQDSNQPTNRQDFLAAPTAPVTKPAPTKSDFVAFAPTNQTPPIEARVNNTASNPGGFSAAPNAVAAPNPGNATPIAASFMGESNKTQPTSAVSAGNSNSAFTKPISTSPMSAPGRITESEMAQHTYKTVWLKIDELVAAEDYYSALKLLSRFYKDETLNGPQRQRLLSWLDALAGKVIFSAEDHLTGQPYLVKPQETLSGIAKRWQIPMELISKVQDDALADREVVPAGTKLKQIPGPFRAELRLKARVITLFLGDMYAGRFPIVIGNSGELKPGEFDIVLKSESGYSWFDSQGKEYPPNSPENGYGPHWIGLSGSLCIHAVPDNTSDGHRGCIGLSGQDAADLFSILSETSKLTIVP